MKLKEYYFNKKSGYTTHFYLLVKWSWLNDQSILSTKSKYGGKFDGERKKKK